MGCGNLPEATATPAPTTSLPNMTGASKSAGRSPWLDPVMGFGAATSTTSGVGLAILVTLRACGHVMGHEMAFPFPLVVTRLVWGGGLTGATVAHSRRGATGTESTINASATR